MSTTPKIPSPSERVNQAFLEHGLGKDTKEEPGYVLAEFARTIARELESSKRQAQAMKEALEECDGARGMHHVAEIVKKALAGGNI